MTTNNAAIGFSGIGIGAVALLLAIVHLWAGPFSPQPSLEKTVAEKAVAIKNATIATLKGEKVEDEVQPNRFDLDRAAYLTAGVLGGLAIILGVISFARREPKRVAAGAVVLGGGTLAFQFIILAIAAIFLAILIAAVLGEIGIE
jgi:hypothetical protein